MVLSRKDEQTARKIVAPEHFEEWLTKGCRPYVNGRKVIYRRGNNLAIKRCDNEEEVANFLNHYTLQNPQIPLSATCLSIMASYNVGQLNDSQKTRVKRKTNKKRK